MNITLDGTITAEQIKALCDIPMLKDNFLSVSSIAQMTDMCDHGTGDLIGDFTKIVKSTSPVFQAFCRPEGGSFVKFYDKLLGTYKKRHRSEAFIKI